MNKLNKYLFKGNIPYMNEKRLEFIVRESVKTGLKEFHKLKDKMDPDKAYMIAQTKALKVFVDYYLK